MSDSLSTYHLTEDEQKTIVDALLLGMLLRMPETLDVMLGRSIVFQRFQGYPKDLLAFLSGKFLVGLDPAFLATFEHVMGVPPNETGGG